MQIHRKGLRYGFNNVVQLFQLKKMPDLMQVKQGDEIKKYKNKSNLLVNSSVHKVYNLKHRKMNRLIFILILLFMAISCKNDDNSIVPLENGDSENELMGQWQLVAHSYSPGTPEQIWQEVEDGYRLYLKSDYQFLSDEIKLCAGGEFEIQGDSLMLDFECAKRKDIYIYTFNVENNFLYLGPVSPYVCFEGCSYKFKRI